MPATRCEGIDHDQIKHVACRLTRVPDYVNTLTFWPVGKLWKTCD
jgi:hypothetical protein